MKAKMSILVAVIVLTTLAIMVSCQKSETTPASAVSSGSNPSGKFGLDIEPDMCGGWDPILQECDPPATNCLCPVDIYGGIYGALKVAISGGSSGVSAFFFRLYIRSSYFPCFME